MGDESYERSTIKSEEELPPHLRPEFQNQFQIIFINGDVEEFKTFMRDNFPYVKDKDDFTLETLFHKGLFNRPGISEEAKQKSLVWLQQHGIDPTIQRKEG